MKKLIAIISLATAITANANDAYWQDRIERRKAFVQRQKEHAAEFAKKQFGHTAATLFAQKVKQ